MASLLLFYFFLFSPTVYGQVAVGPHPNAFVDLGDPDSVEVKAPSLYWGYEIGFGSRSFSLRSDISALDGLWVTSYGGHAGAMVATPRGKLRAQGGLYYSSADLPYTFDLITGAISANLYMLRLGNIRYHTVEPYVLGKVSRQGTKFYGHYLENNAQPHYSSSEQPYLGRMTYTYLQAGIGAEYQLESDHGQFVHIFVEASYGVSVTRNYTRTAFAGTYAETPFFVNVGVSFGRCK